VQRPARLSKCIHYNPVMPLLMFFYV
jgi:hypothetical protein